MMDLLAYSPLDRNRPDGLFDATDAEKFVNDAPMGQANLRGRIFEARLYRTDDGIWVLNEIDYSADGSGVAFFRQVDDIAARTWLRANGYTRVIRRYFEGVTPTS